MSKIFKTIGNVLKGVGKAVTHDVLPIPELKEILKKPSIKTAADLIRSNGNGVKLKKGVAYHLADVLDDGKMNKSLDEVKIETISRVITSVSGFLGIVIYLILEVL